MVPCGSRVSEQFSGFFLISLRGTQSLRNSLSEVLDALNSFQHPGAGSWCGVFFWQVPTSLTGFDTILKGTQFTVWGCGWAR